LAIGRFDVSEGEKGTGVKIQDIRDQVAGVYTEVMIEGEMDAGAWSCGMVVGPINDIATVKELIDRSMADAEAIIRQWPTASSMASTCRSPPALLPEGECYDRAS
jgi:hypothetical protein